MIITEIQISIQRSSSMLLTRFYLTPKPNQSKVWVLFHSLRLLDLSANRIASLPPEINLLRSHHQSEHIWGFATTHISPLFNAFQHIYTQCRSQSCSPATWSPSSSTKTGSHLFRKRLVGVTYLENHQRITNFRRSWKARVVFCFL